MNYELGNYSHHCFTKSLRR